MQYKKLLLVSFVILIIGLTAVSAADSDNTATTDNSGSDVAVDSSSSTAQATDTSTHTDSSVDKTSDASATSSSSQKTDVTSQSSTQKVSEKTSENTQTTSDTTAKATSSDTTAKASSDTSSQSTQSSSQSTQQVQSTTNTTKESTNTVNENVVDTTKSISTDDDVEADSPTVYTIRNWGSFYMAYRESSPGDIFDFEGNFSSFSFEFEKQLSLTSYGNAKFTDVMFTFTSDSSNSVIRNLNFNNSGTGEAAINLESANNIIIQNNSIILDGSNSNGNGIIINNANNITIANNTIKINKSTSGKGITIDNSNYIVVNNNDIALTDLYTNDTYAISVSNSLSNVNITNNNITIENLNSESNYAIGILNSDGVYISGNIVVFNSSSANDSCTLGVFDSSDVIISNNSIKINNTNAFGKAITIKNSLNININNNDILVNAVTDEIDWNNLEGSPKTYGIGTFNSNNTSIKNNNIECYCSKSVNDYSTLIGVLVQGSTSENIKVNNVSVVGNNITVQEDRYGYGVAFHFNVDSCVVSNNSINLVNNNGLYGAGVELEFSTSNNNVTDNNITLSVYDTAYGIVLTGESGDYVNNTIVKNNYINATSDRTRAIELYYTQDCQVSLNTIIVSGNYTEGICGGSAEYTNITNNRIKVNGVYTNSTKDIDEITLVNTGIYLSQAAYENRTNIHSSYINNITGNYIYSYGNSTIFLSASYNDVENNQLTLNRDGTLLYGDDSVYNNGTNNTITNNTGYILSDSNLESETLAVTHVVTQENYQEYFIQKTDTSDGGFTDIVNDGDVLDFQGTINLTNNVSFIINKAVNITSTTGDALICLNTESGSLLGEDQGACFVVNNGGSYSNITNVNFWGTQLWITNASYVVFDNISAIVNGTRVGSGVGQTSIRAGCEYITIKNSYFYTAGNGGSSSLVIAGANYCTLDNNTVETAGDCGNMIYLTTYNTDLEGIDVYNSYNNITNNHLICNDGGVAIRWGIVLTGTDNNVINNTIDYPGGTGITQQFQYTTTNNTKIINNTCINCADSLLPENSTVYGNTFSEVEISAGSTFYNNTLNSINITGEGCIITNNTIQSDLTSNATNNLIENNTFNGENTSINLTAGNNTFKNNQITGNASFILNGNSIILEDNTIEGNVYININGLNNKFTNQQINGSTSYTLNGSFNTVKNNTCGENLQLNITGSNNTFTNQQIYGNVSYYIIGSDNFIENISGTIENLQITIIGSNYNLGNLEISGIASYNITGDNNLIENIEVNGSTSYNITGNSNVIANNTARKTEIANSYLTINGSDNIVENNTIYRITNDLAIIPDSTISISADSNNNIVRYNDIICYDYLRGTTLVGDDCVYVTEGTTGNIVQDNYGTIPEIVIPTPEGTNYTYITYNVTSMAELISALDDIKANGTYSNDTKYVINLLDGDYTVTEAITWDGATSDVREVIINGTGQTINGNNFTSTFLTIGQGYSLILNNVTMKNFPLESSIQTISDSGNLTILNSVLDNAGYIYAQSSTLIINNTNITQTAISAIYGTCNITYSTIYDTDLSSIGMDLIDTFGGNFTFLDNNVTNITSTYLIYGMGGSNSSLIFIEDNTFTDINTTSNSIDIMLNGVEDIAGTLINNTFINGIRINLSPESTKFYKMNNHYINCSIPVNITTIPNSNITTEDYTTTITVSAGSSYGASVDGQIIVSIDGVEYKTFDVVNGKTNITIENSALNLAGNEIEVKYVSPNNGFENASTTFTITLAEDMIIRIPEGTLYSQDTITLTTQVAVNGTIATDGYVIFKVNGKTVKDENGKTIMAYVDENGIASINYTIPDTYSNEYNITAVYSGSEGIVRTNTTLTTSLKTATIMVNPITAKAGQTVTLTAHITDQNGNQVNSGKLIFKLNGKTLKDENGNTLYATIVNGVATLNYTIPDNYSAKEYILTAVYQGTGFERSEANSTLTLTKSTPTIIPDSSVFGNNNTITINQGTESVNIKATIYDPETNAPIDTTTVVTIKINDKTVTQQYVSNGQIDMTIYTSSFTNPEYNITVVVGENSQYARTSFNGTLEIVATSSLANETSYNGTLLVKED